MDIKVGEEEVFLEHVADASSFRREGYFGGVGIENLVTEAEFTVVGSFEACDAVEECGLAAAGGTEDGGDAGGEVGIHREMEAGEVLLEVQAEDRSCHMVRCLRGPSLRMRM